MDKRVDAIHRARDGTPHRPGNKVTSPAASGKLPEPITVNRMSSHAHQDGGATPRSLAEALRFRDDTSLAALLRARPDLLSPVPSDLTQLATRAGTRASVVRALGHLDRFALQTAEALAVAPEPTPYDALRGLLTGDIDPAAPSPGTPATDTFAATIADALPRALATLREQALVWGFDDALRLVRTARELLAPSPRHPSPTGLGPTVAEATAGMSPGRIQDIVVTAGLARTHDSVSAVAALTDLFTDRTRMATLLDGAPLASLDVLSRLLWGPPYGQVTADPAAHLRWLLDRGLLLPTSLGTVTLPREAALHLRGGRAHRDLEPLPPEVAPAAQHTAQVVDTTAAGQAHTSLATVEELLKDWGEAGPAVLRAGGLSVRDLKRVATQLDTTEPLAAFWVELAYAAGLLASDGGFPETAGAGGQPETGGGARREAERYVPTPAYDAWLELPAAERWAALAATWLTATRTAGLVGERDSKDRTLSALGLGLDRSAAPEVRHRVLGLLAQLPEGASPDEAALLARMNWERPLRGVAPDPAQPGHPPQPSHPGRSPQPGRSAPSGWPTQPGPAVPARQSSRPGARSVPAAGAATAITTAMAPQTTGAARPTDHDDLRSRLAQWTLMEAELLGVTGRGALSSQGRALLGTGTDTDTLEAPGTTPTQPAQGTHPDLDAHPDPDAHPGRAVQAARTARAARLLAPLLPEPLDHLLLQADLTAVAPGPLLRPLADMLGILADVESKGGATVYRFTPGSVRRALDAGQTASDLHAFLGKHARTPVPQPLTYLIDDVARRHGQLRVGAASAYIRCDDDAVLGEIMADKRSAGLRLRRLAPTVLAAQADPSTLLEGLRTMGFAPAAESSEGDVLITRAHAQRTGPRTAPEPVPEGPPAPDDTLLSAAVRAIRAGDAASTAPRKPVAEVPEPGAAEARDGQGLPRTGAAETLATVQAAVLTGSALWIGYVNADGAASQRVIAPVRVEGGFVTAFDHTADEVRTYPLHRITGVAELADE